MARAMIILAGLVLVAGAAYISGDILVEDRSATVVAARGRQTHMDGDFRELLGNPGFESGQLPPWTTNNWIVDTKYPHQGTWCGSDVGNFWIHQELDSVPCSEITAVSFWSRQPETAIQGYKFFYDDGTSPQFLVYPGADWTFFDVTAQLDRSRRLVGFRLWGYVGGGPDPDSTFVDDVSIRIPGGRIDAAMVELVYPRDTVPFDSCQIPDARVANLGEDRAIVPVIMRLEDICLDDPYYFDTVEVAIEPGDTVPVEFAPWAPNYPALHRARCWTELPGDSTPANDTLEHFFWVLPGVGIEAQPVQPPMVLQAWPVPARDILNLTGCRAAAVHDAQGRKTMALAAGSNDIRQLGAGIYFIRPDGRGAKGRPPAIPVIVAR